MTEFRDALRPALPDDAATAALAGRVWRPDVGGPSVVALRGGAKANAKNQLSEGNDRCTQEQQDCGIESA